MKKIPTGPNNVRPAATPVAPEKAGDVFGCMAGTAELVGNVEAPVVCVRAWKAAR